MGKVLVMLLVVVVVFSLAVGAIATFAFREVRGSGNIITESREVGNFSRVSICCGMQLQVTQSSPNTLQLEGDDNIVPALITSVKGDLLDIKLRRPALSIRPSQPVIARVTMPEVSGLDVSGGGRVETTTLDTPQLEVDLSGGSTGLLSALTVDNLKSNISGGGVLEVAGSATHFALNSSGGSHYNGKQLQSQSADIDISGGGSAIVWVEETLEVNASGGSHVDYYGSANVSQSASGGSRVTHLGDQP